MAMRELGTKVDIIDVANEFKAPEGELDLIYGKIGTGKTYLATTMVWGRFKRRQISIYNMAY